MAACRRARMMIDVPPRRVRPRREKYVVVDEKEEWDGGSRGRVKTKGKRGPGYV